MKVVHEWLGEYLKKDLPSPQEVERLLTFHAFEVEGIEQVGDKQVIDVDILPNRGSDCLCHRGIARELATLLDVPLAHDPLTQGVTLKESSELKLSLADTHACRRFSIALVKDVQVGESPQWLRERLEALGQRSINNVVDATNYVMLSLGQPLHAYDAEKFVQKDGVWHVGVRYARDGEMITTLTGEEYELDPSVQLIVNGANDTPAGIAGIKGGAYAEVTAQTRHILIEAANFDPAVTRKASQRIRLQTDASKRFENEPSPELVPHAQVAVIALIEDIAQGTFHGWTDTYPTVVQQQAVVVRPQRVCALLGLSLSDSDIASILKRIGATVTTTDDGFSVQGPYERTDLTIEEDFIEEVGRIHGYEHVQSVVPDPVPLTEFNARHYYSERVRDVLIAEGFSEVITSSFRKKDDVRLRNALASDKAYLRSALSKNIREVLDRNASHLDLLGLTQVRVFEIGTVFEKTTDGVSEHVSLCMGIQSKKQGYTPNDDALLHEVCTKLQHVLGVAVVPSIQKGVAEIDLSALLNVLPAPTHYEPYERASDVQYHPFSSYPHVSRDIALWVQDTTTEDEVAQVLNDAAGELRVRTTLFDQFEKDGRTSYAFRLVFQSYEKTLTDSEVNPIMDGVYQAVGERGWEVR